MKILFVIHDFLPYTFAGSEVYTYSLAKELQKRGHQVQVFCRNIVKADENQKKIKIFRENYNDIPIFEIYNNFTKYNTSKEYYINPKIDQIFEEYIKTEFKPDIIHFQHLHTLSIGMIDIAKKYNIPTIMTLHDYWPICHRIQLLKLDGKICNGPKNGIKCLGCIKTNKFLINKCFSKSRKFSKIPQKIVYPIANILEKIPNSQIKDTGAVILRPSTIKEKLNTLDQLISPSKFLRSILIKNGIDSSKITFIDNGTIYPKVIKNKIKNKKYITFGFIGTIVEYKGLHIIYEAQKILPKNIRKKIRFNIYGDIKNKNSQEYLKHFNIKENKNFKFLGKFNNQKINEIHSRLDYMVIPSLWYENSPVTIHEAIIYKTPILGTNIGGIPELIKRHKAGKTFKFNSPISLAKLIVKIVNESPKFKFNPPVKSIKENSKEIEKIYSKMTIAS